MKGSEGGVPLQGLAQYFLRNAPRIICQRNYKIYISALYAKNNERVQVLLPLKKKNLKNKRTMMVLYCSPEQTDLHTYCWSFSQVHCSKIFVYQYMYCKKNIVPKRFQ